ncbi:helix-turn-helix transcriptional regulator [Bacillus spizizenii]|nr:helix-turn-helix domain-containing protein [Bacillus spizizenii]MCY8890490.1 helix-turn-helix domain-containing protein [Bacillus spizizenii]MEC0841945.1 helix-turn-helix transcriptional regulator [Bacillus spizizenii]
MEERYKEFGEFMKHMRKSVGWSAAEMGERLGVFRTTITRWEKGQNLSAQDIFVLELKIRHMVKEELYDKRLQEAG